jgi:hypothetical protein
MMKQNKPSTKLSREPRALSRGARALWRARAALLLSLAAAVASCALAACGGKDSQSQNARPPKSDFERSLDTIRTGQHVRIYVIRRPDGQPLQPEDRKYLREIEPMWVVTQDGTTAIAGAGFEFEPPLLAEISKRFTVEDYTGK